MSKRPLIIAATVTALALAALLAYSLERTSWLFGLFEASPPLAVAAAVVVELAAVALLCGAGALASMDVSARAWANRALLAVLSVQALANLSAGYLRGGHRTLAAFGDGWAAYAVAAALWLVTNLAVPGLILCLSKLLERLLSHIAAAPAAVSTPAPQPTAAAPETTAAPPQTTEDAPHPSPRQVAVTPEKLAGYLPILAAFDRDPKTRTADLASAANVSARTAESRRSELVKLGALHKTDQGYVRNGVELTAE